MELKVVLEPSEEGGFTAYVPSLPGCISEGKTKDQALKNIRPFAMNKHYKNRPFLKLPLTLHFAHIPKSAGDFGNNSRTHRRRSAA